MVRSRPHRVTAICLEGVAPFELGVVYEVFGIDRSDLVDPWYDLTLVTETGGPVAGRHGVIIDSGYGLDALRRADTIVCLPWTITGPVPAPVLDALRRAHARGARLLSVCSGVFMLAEAGLLDGRCATTHWMHSDDLAARFPDVKVDPRVLYVDDGDILTSAGTAAGVDLCLHVVRLDHGAEVANGVARRMVVPPHRDGGQAQYVDAPVPADAGDSDDLSWVLGWMIEHLDQSMSVDALAGRAAMSPRTFARRFRSVTGTTPHQWLLTQRILLAQRLLETTDEPVELVADRSGFGSAGALRLHFQRSLGIAPLAYRRTFRRPAGRVG